MIRLNVSTTTQSHADVFDLSISSLIINFMTAWAHRSSNVSLDWEQSCFSTRSKRFLALLSNYYLVEINIVNAIFKYKKIDWSAQRKLFLTVTFALTIITSDIVVEAIFSCLASESKANVYLPYFETRSNVFLLCFRIRSNIFLCYRLRKIRLRFTWRYTLMISHDILIRFQRRKLVM